MKLPSAIKPSEVEDVSHVDDKEAFAAIVDGLNTFLARPWTERERLTGRENRNAQLIPYVRYICAYYEAAGWRVRWQDSALVFWR
jgi:hypothetical protein